MPFRQLAAALLGAAPLSDSSMKFIQGISEIIDQYDNFIIDLWGVLHDGHDAYNGAKPALLALKKKKKKIVLLSNAPRRVSIVKTKMDELGFTEDTYDKLITSGEITHNYIKNNLSELGKKCYYIGPERERNIIKDLGLIEVEKASKADFAVATGFNDYTSTFEERKHQLDDCLSYKLKLIVANPDKLVVKQTGEVQICSGMMGDYYSENDGQVVYFGKPYQNAYDECLKFFGARNAERILCIGDSLHTDIAGANIIGAGGLFVAGGMHRRDVMNNKNIIKDKLKKLVEVEKQSPTFVIEEFRF